MTDNNAPQTQTWCHFCDRSGTLFKKCSRCCLVRYCSPVCQRADWKHHATECEEGARPIDVGDGESVVPTMTVFSCDDAEGGANAVIDRLKAYGTLQHETRGVPTGWSAALLFSEPGSKMQCRAYSRFALSAPPGASPKFVDDLVGLCRRTDVRHAYDTHGSISNIDRTLVDGAINWNIRREFKDRVLAIASEHDSGDDVCDTNQLMQFMSSVMNKRARPEGNPRAVSHNGRQFVFIIAANRGIWFDVTYTSDATSHHASEPMPTPEPPRTCIACQAKARQRCMACGARYCSVKCQSADWPAHKTSCRA